MPPLSALLAVGIGGGLGAMARLVAAGLAAALLGSAFPWGILLVNISGCLVMGLVAGSQLLDGVPTWRAFVATGIMGGYTTFSTFSLDALQLMERREFAAAFGYIGGSLFGCLVAVAAGYFLARALFATA